jgi:hypothetical protein
MEWQKIVNRFVFPILVGLNLLAIGYSFQILQTYAPNYQFLGLVLYATIRYVIFEIITFRNILEENLKQIKDSSPWVEKFLKNKFVKNLSDYLQL